MTIETQSASTDQESALEEKDQEAAEEIEEAVQALLCRIEDEVFEGERPPLPSHEPLPNVEQPNLAYFAARGLIRSELPDHRLARLYILLRAWQT